MRMPKSVALGVLVLAPVLGAQDGCSTEPTPSPTPTPNAPCAQETWLRTWGSGELDEAWGVGLAANGDVYISSHEANPLQTDAFLRRMTPDGEVLWTQSAGGEWSEQAFLPVESEGIVYVGGLQFHSLDFLDTHALLLRFDAETGAEVGDPWIWTSPGWDEIDGIAVEGDAIYLSGFTEGEGGTQDVRVVRLTKELETVWDVTQDFQGTDAANGHLVLLGDMVYVAGGVGVEGGADVLLAAFDKADGGLRWARHPETVDHDWALGLASDGVHLYGVGEGQVAPDDGQILIWAWDAEGALLWRKDWGGPGADYARGIAVDPTDGSLLIAGNTERGGAGEADVALLRVDAETGAVLEVRTWGEGGREEVHDLVVTESRAFIAGQTTSWGAGGDDAFAMGICHRPWSLPETGL